MPIPRRCEPDATTASRKRLDGRWRGRVHGAGVVLAGRDPGAGGRLFVARSQGRIGGSRARHDDFAPEAADAVSLDRGASRPCTGVDYGRWTPRRELPQLGQRGAGDRHRWCREDHRLPDKPLSRPPELVAFATRCQGAHRRAARCRRRRCGVQRALRDGRVRRTGIRRRRRDRARRRFRTDDVCGAGRRHTWLLRGNGHPVAAWANARFGGFRRSVPRQRGGQPGLRRTLLGPDKTRSASAWRHTVAAPRGTPSSGLSGMSTEAQ